MASYSGSHIFKRIIADNDILTCGLIMGRPCIVKAVGVFVRAVNINTFFVAFLFKGLKSLKRTILYRDIIGGI